MRNRKVIIGAAVALLVMAAAGLFLYAGHGNAGQKEKEEILAFATAYANYFVGRDGDKLVGLYIDEETAYENMILLEEAGGKYTFGYSSPWPDEFRMTIDEKARKVSIRYYAWTSDPHVTVWKEEMTFAKTRDGYRATGSTVRQFDAISSGEEFEEAYLVFDEYQFVDYVERGYVDAINEQTAYDRETGAGEDRNAVYRNPDTAAERIFNLSGGEAVVTGNSGGRAVVKYTFADGSSIDFPMYNANDASETDDVWIVDVGSWNAKAP